MPDTPRNSTRSSARFALKVIAGPNAGTEMALRPGVYVVGRSRDCDVVLSDETLADKHIRLWVKVTGVQVEPLAEPIRISGIRIDRNPVTVRTYRRIQAGNTVISIGEIGRPWPKMLLDDPQDDGFTAAEAAWVRGADTPAASQRFTRIEQRFDFWLPRVAMGLLLLFLAAVVSNALERPTSPAVGDPSEIRRLSAALESAPNGGNIGIRSGADGHLEVVGFVNDAGELSALRRSLERSGVPYLWRVWNLQEVAASAETILRALGLPYVSVEAGQSGKLVMKGFVDQESNWRRALAILREDLPAATTIDDSEVSTLAARAEALRQLVAHRELTGKLEVTINDNQLELSGELSREERPKLRELREEFRTRYGEYPRLVDNVREFGQTRLELQIRSVSMGPEPYVELKNGKKLTVGSVLDDGMKIESISTREIGLTKGDLKTTYVIGDN